VRADEQKPDTRRERRTSGQMTAKSSSIKGAERKFGGCARKAVGLTSGDLRRVLESGLRRAARPLSAAQKSAKGIVDEVCRRPERSPEGVEGSGK